MVFVEEEVEVEVVVVEGVVLGCCGGGGVEEDKVVGVFVVDFWGGDEFVEEVVDVYG